MLGNLFRAPIDRVVLPMGRALGRAGITANAITIAAVPVVGFGAWLGARGVLGPGGWIVAAGGLFDLFDGAVAKATGTQSRFGGFLDSTADRVSDAAILSGIAWYLGSRGDRLGLGLALGAAAGSFLTSYIRARAEAAGFDCNVGFAERFERTFIAAAGMILHLLRPALILLIAVSSLTVVQRLVHVWRQSKG